MIERVPIQRFSFDEDDVRAAASRPSDGNKEECAMRRGFRISRLMTAGIVSVALALTTVTLIGQGRTKDAKAVKVASAVPNIPIQNPNAPNTTPVPLNAMDSRPDLNGMWQYRTSTPMQRAQNLGTKVFYTPEEGEALGKRITEQRNADVISDKPEVEAYQKGMNTVWFEYGGPLLQYRTSLIVDPPDGRMPAAAN